MYEQGVIRPPSEASSLLVRVTRNCPWNQCVFCPAYKGVKFSRRTVDEVKKDIDAMAAEYGRSVRVNSVFLQDADSLVLPTDDLVTILEYLRERFPRIERITTYARARTLKRKSVDDLRRLKEAGLTRVHAGLESGSEKVLQLIKKGLTPEEIVTGGRHVMDAGLELSEYVMPGIGGLALSEEHASGDGKGAQSGPSPFYQDKDFCHASEITHAEDGPGRGLCAHERRTDGGGNKGPRRPP